MDHYIDLHNWADEGLIFPTYATPVYQARCRNQYENSLADGEISSAPLSECKLDVMGMHMKYSREGTEVVITRED